MVITTCSAALAAGGVFFCGGPTWRPVWPTEQELSSKTDKMLTIIVYQYNSNQNHELPIHTYEHNYDPTDDHSTTKDMEQSEWQDFMGQKWKILENYL